jgi:polysaccharide export outer membrane protein
MNDEERGERRHVACSPNWALQSEFQTMEIGPGSKTRVGLRCELLRCFWRQKSSLVVWSIAFLVVALCAGCQGPAGTQFPEQTTPKTPVSLTPGDVIKLSFPATPDLNQSQKIRADGKVNLPMIGEVTAAGKTLGEFQSELIRLYAPQVKNADVVVTLESAVAQVIISGAVAKPAKLLFERPTTIFQAIMEAGGLNEYGSFKNVHVIRLVGGRQHTQILDLRSTLRGQPTQPFYVKDGDVIYVPPSPF